MLCTRVIPVVLLDGYSVVKTIQFRERRNLGNPITVARIYASRNVDELILLDVDASKQGRRIDFFTIEDVARECFMPLTVGGGLQSLEDVATVLQKGADKVVINTIALRDFGFVRAAVSEFGSQCIVASIDAEADGTGGWRVWSHAGVAVEGGVTDLARRLAEAGCGEIFLNAVARDGKMCGYDTELIAEVCGAVPRVPVIACGGAACVDDGVAAVQAGAAAVAASSIFHFTSITPDDIRSELRANGITVRHWEE